MSDSQRAMELGWAGLSPAATEGVSLFLSAMPRLHLAVLCEVEGGRQSDGRGPRACKVGGVRVWSCACMHGYEGCMGWAAAALRSRNSC